ncbi:acyltransferase family protein [Hirschia litorea]|uniref:Acyltransferase family protein n=1 Tax=Hirschia litorea TaxID=1199156 RepID=A0ABW2IPY1_9PROT
MFYIIHILRGIAALLVAGFHLNAASDSEGYATPIFDMFAYGAVGVDIFFVISGFVIFLSASRSKSWVASDFLVKRFFRIYPIYWLFLGVFLALSMGLFLATGDASKLPTSEVLLKSFLLWPSDTYAISIAWTLTIEMTFYLLFCLCYQGKTASLGPVWRVLGVWSGLSVFCSLLGWNIGGLSTLFHPAVPELVLGVIIAKLYLSGVSAGAIPASIVGAIGLIAALMIDYEAGYASWRAVWVGLPAALFIYGTLGIERRLGREMRLFGDASFVLYLLHIPAFLVIGFLVEKGLGYNIYSSDLSMGLVLVVVMCGAFLAHLIIEKPYQNWYRGFLAKRKVQGPNAKATLKTSDR